MGKIKDFVKGYKLPLLLTAGSLGTWAVGATVEPELVRNFGDNAYMWRFASYIPFALAGAEASKTFWENRVGRPLTLWEKTIAYTSGAVVASAIYEGWEHYGAQAPVQEKLRYIADTVNFEGLGKNEFYAKGAVSDIVKTTLGALGIEGAKEYVSKIFKRKRKTSD